MIFYAFSKALPARYGWLNYWSFHVCTFVNCEKKNKNKNKKNKQKKTNKQNKTKQKTRFTTP